MAFLLNGPEDEDTTVKMPLALFLKQLTMKMASLQSPRTQCCCCAIGVFAAMFGIFMLSAGICIVLNVTFMEVDTSGLPPELHNEEGKKVVGIILICVSIATLGLSASVSVVYFVVCNRKPRALAPTNASTQPTQQPGPTSPRQVMTPGVRTPGNVTPGVRTPGSVTPAGGHHRRASGNTQSTERYLRREASTVDRVPIGRSVSPQLPGRNMNPNITGPRRPRRPNAKPHKPHRRTYRPELPSHLEEDLEATRSVNDFHMNQPSTESSSNSGTSTSPSGQSIRTSEDRYTGSQRKNSMPPVIVVHDTSLATVASSAEHNLAETTFVEYGARPGCVKSGTDFDHVQGPPQRDSVMLVSEINDDASDPWHPRHSHKVNSTTSQGDLDMATPPSLPYNIDVMDDVTSHDVNNRLATTFPPTSSRPQHSHNVLLVRSHDETDQVSPWSSTNTLDITDLIQEEEADHVSDLPSQHFPPAAATVGPHEPPHHPSSGADDFNSRSESRASYNSAFSFNGEEQGETLEEVKRRLEGMQKD